MRENIENMNNKDIELISLVERFPHLYDKNDAKYKDRLAVENSWLFISGELQTSSEYTYILLYYSNII